MVNGINTVSANAVSQQSSSNATSQQVSLSSDFETFLQMLTAQAKYQDPLEPMDSTEYASQLAQFSAVEQSVRTNELLEAMAGQLGVQDASSMAAWIGMEVKHSSEVNFSGQPITLSYESVEGSRNAELVVFDEFGQEFQRHAIDHNETSLTLASSADDGIVLPPGRYSFAIEHFSDSSRLSSASPHTYGRVSEVELAEGGGTLVLEDGTSIEQSDVLAARLPD